MQAGKKRKAPPKAAAAGPSAPARGSSRLAVQPRVSYKPPKAVLPSDDESSGAESDDDEEEEDAEIDDDEEEDDDASAYGSDDEEVEGGGGGGGGGASSSGGGRSCKRAKGKQAAKPSKGKAKATEGKALKSKIRMSTGPNPSVVPGGRGFKCPSAGCDTFFDTAEEAIAHGAEECGVEG